MNMLGDTNTNGYTPPFKSLGSLRNVLVFERKAIFLSIKITSNQKYSVDIFNGASGFGQDCSGFGH